MSNWTIQEVRQLDEKNGGGNRLAEERWVSRAPESVRPTQSSSMDAIKSFVDRAYNQKAWEGPVQSSGSDKPSRDGLPQSARCTPAQEPGMMTVTAVNRKPTAPMPMRAPEPAPASVADLLDLFDAPPAAAAKAATPAPGCAPQPVAKHQCGGGVPVDPSFLVPGPTESSGLAMDLSFDPLASAVVAVPDPAAVDAQTPGTGFPSFDPFAKASALSGTAVHAGGPNSLQPQPQQSQQLSTLNLGAGSAVMQQAQPMLLVQHSTGHISSNFAFVNGSAGISCGLQGAFTTPGPLSAHMPGAFAPTGINTSWYPTATQTSQIGIAAQSVNPAMSGVPTQTPQATLQASPQASPGTSPREIACAFDPFAPVSSSYAAPLCA